MCLVRQQGEERARSVALCVILQALGVATACVGSMGIVALVDPSTTAKGAWCVVASVDPPTADHTTSPSEPADPTHRAWTVWD